MVYDKKKLEDIVEEWNDWREYKGRFNDKDGPGPADPDLRLKVGTKWNKINPKEYPKPGFLIGKPDDKFYEAILKGNDISDYIVSEYAKENLDNVFSVAAKDNLKGLYSLVFSLPHQVKTGNTKNDEIRGLISKVKELGSYYEREGEDGGKKPQETEKMQQYIYSQILGEKDTPEFIKKCRLDFAAYIMANSPNDTKLMFERYRAEKWKELQEKFSEDYDKTKLNKGRIIDYIRDTIDYLKREEEKEKDEDKKDKLKDAREAIYQNLAQTAYISIKAGEEK